MKKKSFHSKIILILSTVILLYGFAFPNDLKKTSNISPKTPSLDELRNMDFSYLRDTLYTLQDYYIEINLKTQMGYLYSRNESVKEFGVSTGTRRLKDGVNTKEGLFIIQNKYPKLPSVQFDSTMMLNWMGFNWGIGFHALYGSSYYQYLGVKPSSHGCVRLSKEDAKEIYSKISVGTPVLIHSGNNVVKIAFANPNDDLKYYSFNNLKKMLPNRYYDLYTGKYFISGQEKLLIDKNNVDHAGLPIGDNSRVAKRQIIKPHHYFIESVIPEPKTAELFPRENLFGLFSKVNEYCCVE